MEKKSRVELEWKGHQFAEAIYAATKRTVEAAGDIALAEVRATPSDYAIGTILDKVMRTGAERSPKGAAVFIVAQDWRSIFFELGTYDRRRRKRKEPRRTDRPNKGVRPEYFLLHAVGKAREAMPDLLARELNQISL